MKIHKLYPAFLPDLHKGICESGLSGPVLAWRGERHVENGSDLDGLQALQTVGVLYVRRRIARYSRAPKMTIFRHAADRPSEHIDKQLLKNQNKTAKYFDKNYKADRRKTMIKLKAGDKAPFIELLNQDNTTRKLSDFSSRKILIFFYPKAGTSG
jgi:hypothetical protein